MCKFKSSSVGNASIISFGNISKEDTPIGFSTLFNEYSTVNLFFPLHSINPIVSLSLSVFNMLFTAFSLHTLV